MDVSSQPHSATILPRYQLDRRLSGPLNRSGRGGEAPQMTQYSC